MPRLKFSVLLASLLLATSLYAGTTVTVPGTGSGGVSPLNIDVPGGVLGINIDTSLVDRTFLPLLDTFSVTPPECLDDQHMGVDVTQIDGKYILGLCPAGTGSSMLTEPFVAKIDQVCLDGTDCQTVPDGQDGTLNIIIGNNLTGTLTRTGNTIEITIAAPVQEKCTILDSVASTDDNMPFGSFANAVTITGVWAHYMGSAPTLAATFTLEDGGGNAMTITGTNPTVAAPNANATIAAVTANNTLAAGELLRFDVTNTPNPDTDTYQLCVRYTIP